MPEGYQFTIPVEVATILYMMSHCCGSYGSGPISTHNNYSAGPSGASGPLQGGYLFILNIWSTVTNIILYLRATATRFSLGHHAGRFSICDPVGAAMVLMTSSYLRYGSCGCRST